jgi:hypothetical protein
MVKLLVLSMWPCHIRTEKVTSSFVWKIQFFVEILKFPTKNCIYKVFHNKCEISNSPIIQLVEICLPINPIFREHSSRFLHKRGTFWTISIVNTWEFLISLKFGSNFSPMSKARLSSDWPKSSVMTHVTYKMIKINFFI